MLDGMSPRKKPKISQEPPAAKINDIPDGVLALVISFLPARDAVGTSAVGRRWRHLWTSAPALRVTAVEGFGTPQRFNDFVDRLLFLRRQGEPPLKSCEFHLVRNEFDFDWLLSAEHVWSSSLQSALDCRVQALRCRFRIAEHDLADLPYSIPEHPVPPPLLSQHLKTLELHRVRSVLDFSGCPSLVDLKMEDRVTSADQVSSASLRHLTMICCDFDLHRRTTMSLPNLVHLELIDSTGRIPSLQSLPSLETAVIRLGLFCDDSCLTGLSGCLDGNPCRGCEFYLQFDAHRKSSFFLQGLVGVKHLELSASYGDALLFQRDLKWCPPFSMLKTLILNDWCLSAELSAVIRFIRHSPNLEKLTLEIFEEFHSSMVTEKTNHLLERAFSSNHVKMVEIKCRKLDERILKILKIMSTCGISLVKVNIRETKTSSGSGCSSYAACACFQLKPSREELSFKRKKFQKIRTVHGSSTNVNNPEKARVSVAILGPNK